MHRRLILFLNICEADWGVLWEGLLAGIWLVSGLVREQGGGIEDEGGMRNELNSFQESDGFDLGRGGRD